MHEGILHQNLVQYQITMNTLQNIKVHYKVAVLMFQFNGKHSPAQERQNWSGRGRSSVLQLDSNVICLSGQGREFIRCYIPKEIQHLNINTKSMSPLIRVCAWMICEEWESIPSAPIIITTLEAEGQQGGKSFSPRRIKTHFNLSPPSQLECTFRVLLCQNELMAIHGLLTEL